MLQVFDVDSKKKFEEHKEDTEAQIGTYVLETALSENERYMHPVEANKAKSAIRSSFASVLLPTTQTTNNEEMRASRINVDRLAGQLFPVSRLTAPNVNYNIMAFSSYMYWITNPNMPAMRPFK